MPDNSAYLAFLQDPNQELRKAELRTFFGPNADTFLAAYDRLREDTPAVSGRKPAFRLFNGFEPAAFFLGPVWFFYRKMWTIAWVIVGLLVVVALIPFRSSGLILSLILAGMARRVYVQHAVQKLSALHRDSGAVAPSTVADLGGVSKPAGYISGTIFILLWVAGVVSVVYLAMHGVRPD